MQFVMAYFRFAQKGWYNWSPVSPMAAHFPGSFSFFLFYRISYKAFIATSPTQSLSRAWIQSSAI